MDDQEKIDYARQLLSKSSNVLIHAGAGMSADLGVPTYWTGVSAAYAGGANEDGLTDYQHVQAPIVEGKPELSAKYFRRKYAEILDTPVDGEDSHYVLLKNWLDEHEKNYFVATSNVDSAFFRAGYDVNRLFEVHGTYRHSQCMFARGIEHSVFLTLDPRKSSTHCPYCGDLTRPNVLLFGDFRFDRQIVDMQNAAYNKYLRQRTGRLVVLEIGAGTTVPAIRNLSTTRLVMDNAPVIRINPFHVGEDELDGRGVPLVELKMSAADGLAAVLR